MSIADVVVQRLHWLLGNSAPAWSIVFGVIHGMLTPQAELDAELAELRASEQSEDVKRRMADIRQELSHYRTGGRGWLGLW